MARQVALACFFLVALMNSVSWKYHPFSTPAHKESGLVIRRQPCFPSIARLKHLRSRKANAPYALRTGKPAPFGWQDFD